MAEHTTKVKRPTIKDIARESGYSKTAVSFAFNDPSRISKKACEQILSTAEKLGYIPDPMARNFSLRRHLSIGFLLPQEIQYSLNNPYTQQVLLGIGSVCEKFGYTLTLIPPLNESVTEAVRNAAVDGLITMGMQVDMDIVSVMQTRHLSYVTIDGTADKQMPSVNINDEEASYEIMKTVLQAGHRQLCIIGLGKDVFAENATSPSLPSRRLAGYRRALEEVNLSLDDVTMLVCEPTLEEGKKKGNEILALDKNITCVVAMSDIVAIGCILSWSEAGKKIPQDISIAGFDNIDEASFITPKLTTIDQPAHEKGRLAAQALFQMINKAPLESVHIEIPYTLIKRDSVFDLTSQQL